jgi:hypothetical protein
LKNTPKGNTLKAVYWNGFEKMLENYANYKRYAKNFQEKIEKRELELKMFPMLLAETSVYFK